MRGRSVKAAAFRQRGATRKLVSGGLPTDLDFEKALMFFHAYMYGPLQGKLRLYRARDVHSVGKAQPSDWEVFASILVKDVGTKLTKGVDLSKYEVKSAENGDSYEYEPFRAARNVKCAA
jgi:hypothetical protein